MEESLSRVHDLRTQDKRSLSIGSRIAIVGGHNFDGGLHVGILFMNSEDKNSPELMCLHLMWHWRLVLESALKSEFVTEKSLFYIDIQMEEEQEDVLIAYFRNIFKKNDRHIRYSFRYSDAHFDKGGKFQGGQDLGLTCATLILAAFESGGYPLVEKEHWPARAEDDARQQRRIQNLRNDLNAVNLDPGIEAHLRALDQMVGCPNFRAEEVAAAGTSPEHPASFEHCEGGGRAIVQYFLGQQPSSGTGVG